MNEIEFVKWPKIGRMNKLMTVTEKIDGENAAVRFIPAEIPGPIPDAAISLIVSTDHDPVWVAVQSRSRFIKPSDDMNGLASWVYDNSIGLYNVLGLGTHFGEWWGKGIHRGYGLNERRFSLFNTKRWNEDGTNVPGLYSVPVLIESQFNPNTVGACLGQLEVFGSVAAPGFMQPEGVVVFHHGIGEYLKVPIDGGHKTSH